MKTETKKSPKTKNTKPKEDTLCNECRQRVYSYQNYVWAKSKGGRVNFVHKDCYKKLCGNKEN